MSSDRRRIVKRGALALMGSALALSAVVLIRGWRFNGEPAMLPPIPGPRFAIDTTAAAKRLAAAIRFRTVHGSAPEEEFFGLHELLRAAYPLVHRHLVRETVGGLSLLYTWPGSDAATRPVMLAGHLDVVPAETGATSAWEHPPFGGEIAGGYVWGRGSMDDKCGVLGILEAVEHLLAAGFRPRRTIYLAFGHDEETGGDRGAAEIARLLGSRNVKLEFLLDEGGNITDGIVPGVDRPVALIGVAEKGAMSLEFSVEQAGGHSSMPPPQTAVGILAGAIARLEADPFPLRLSEPSRAMLLSVATAMRWPEKFAVANLWLFEPLVLRGLERSPSTAALIRTTQAPTLLQAGHKDNVLPNRARAVINFRILPGDSSAAVFDRVRRVVADDRVKLALRGVPAEPSAPSRADSPGFRAIARALRAAAPDALPAPFLLMAGTDSRHYAEIAENVFRFLPIKLEPRDTERYHGANERIAVEDFGRAIRFYALLLRAADSDAQAMGSAVPGKSETGDRASKN